LTDIFPGSEVNRVSGILLLNSCPPKSFNDSCQFSNKGFGEEDGSHIINMNGRENRLNIGESTSMVKFVGLNSGKFCMKFILDKSISFVPIFMVKTRGCPR